MIAYLEKALNVRRDELAPASLLFLYLFFAIGCYIMGQAVGDALFLSAFPNSLPQGIVATAMVVGIFTSVHIHLAHRVRIERMMTGSLLFFAATFGVFWQLAQSGESWVYPLLYVWVYTVGALAPTMGWTLANHCLTTREARRVFGFIGAGAILGAPCAGFLTAALTRQAGWKPETLLLVIAAGTAGCALCVRALFEQRRERLTETEWTAGAAETPRTIGQVWSIVRSSRYLALIAALITIGCCATTVVGYQFKLIARQSYAGDAAGLAAFFGTFNGYVGLSAFVLQMLLTGRLLRSLGIRVTLFIMPVVFLGGSLGVLLAPVLASAVLLRASQGLLRYSVDKSTTELLYLPVTPPALKGQIKSFIDGFVWRVADGVGGLFLYLFANPLNFSPSRMSLLNFVFLAGWIGIAYGVRREYLTVLRSAIEHRRLDPEKTATGVLDATTAEVLAHSLERGNEQQALYGLSLLELGREPAWHPALRKLLEHPSPAVRQRALHLLGETKQPGMAEQVDKMLADESLEVRAEALQYLVTHEQKDPVLLLQTAKNVPAHCLQSAVAVHLARGDDPGWLAAAGHILQGMTAETGLEGAPMRREAARAIGSLPGRPELHAHLITLLDDASDKVSEQALLSAGRLGTKELLPKIAESLGRHPGAARAALTQYGDAAVAALRGRLNDHSIPGGMRRQIPKVLARIGTAEAAQALSGSLIQSDPEVRYEAIKALNHIHARHPERVSGADEISRALDYELLAYYRSFQILGALDRRNGSSQGEQRKSNSLVTQAVRERMEQELERVFRLLGLIYPAGDVRNSYLSLTSHRPQLQANALEVLEYLLPSDLYRRLAAVADPESTSEGRLERVRRLCQAGVESAPEALRILLHSGDGWLCACALHTIGLARVRELETELDGLNCREPIGEQTRKWAAQRLAGNNEEGDTMLSALEKVDLLRNARFFEPLPTESLVRVAAIADELSWAPHQVVYHEGSRAEAILVVLEGEVELIRAGNVVARIGPNQAPGGLAALANGRHSESAVVSQPTRALRMGREEFFEAMAEDFRVAQGIVKALAGMAGGAA